MFLFVVYAGYGSFSLSLFSLGVKSGLQSCDISYLVMREKQKH